MTDNLDFNPLDGKVVEVDAYDIVVDVADERPAQGTLVQVGPDRFRVIGYEGTRRIRCQGIRRHSAKSGQSAKFAKTMAGWPRPTHLLDVGEATWEPDGLPIASRRIPFFELRADQTPKPIGLESLDVVAPAPAFGSLLLVQPGTAGRDELLRRLGGATISLNAGPAKFQIKGRHPHDELMAYRIAGAWAGALRDDGNGVVLATELPTRSDTIDQRPQGAPAAAELSKFIDGFLDGLSSTQSASILTVLHLNVSASHNLYPVLDTLPLGSFDAVWFLDEAGVPDLSRCTSKAADGSAAADVLAQMERLRFLESQESLGLLDPEDENLEALRARVSRLATPLLDGPMPGH